MKLPSVPQLARAQGAYFVVTGVWPLMHGTSFQALTGFKTNFWLAQLVGALIALIGGVLVAAARQRPFAAEFAALGAGSAFLLGVADLLCVPLPETTRIYWADAALEFGLVALWVLAWRATGRRTRSRG
ncbi:MAG TPA: hypothetical protein VEB66_01360 [Opitutaceae bacterium]|nr:hypothetical protein [Opitutaceae bacterium]